MANNKTIVGLFLAINTFAVLFLVLESAAALFLLLVTVFVTFFYVLSSSQGTRPGTQAIGGTRKGISFPLTSIHRDLGQAPRYRPFSTSSSRSGRSKTRP